MTEQAVFYDIVKTVSGSLSLNLPAYDSTAPNRKVSIPHNVEKVRVPRIFALGVFVDGTLENMYKQGYFRIEPAKQYEAEVAAIFFPVEDKAPVLSEKEALDLLIKGNRVRVRELLQDNEAAHQVILTVANEHLGDIPSSMVADLEKMLGVELRVDE